MKNIGKIFGYLAAAALAAAFAVYIDGKIGWFFLTVLAVSVCLSVGLAFFVRRSVRISAEVDKNLLYKGEKLTLRIKISGIFPFPAGFAAVRTSQCGSLDSDNDGGGIYMLIPDRSELNACNISAEYTAARWGTDIVGVTECEIIDFLGFVHLKVNISSVLNDCIFKVSVCPDIPEINDETGLVRYISSSAFADESEETKETHSFGGGTPGFEHREYSAGDPVKRINWKLSAKRDRLMVRLDDAVISTRQMIVLDCVSVPTAGLDIGGRRMISEKNQTAAEAMLGLISELIGAGVGCIVSVMFGRSRRTAEINSLEDLSRFRIEMASASMNEPSEELFGLRIPEGAVLAAGKDSPVVVFTAYPDAELARLADIRGTSCGGIVCCAAETDAESCGSFADLRIICGGYTVRRA